MIKNIIRYKGYTTFVGEDNKMGIIDKNDSVIIDGFDNISEFQKGGVAEFKNNNKFGFIDIYGNILIKDVEMTFFNKEYYTILTYKKNGKYNLINLKGEAILENLEYISNINSNGTFIYKKDGKEITYNLEGKEIIDTFF